MSDLPLPVALVILLVVAVVGLALLWVGAFVISQAFSFLWWLGELSVQAVALAVADRRLPAPETVEDTEAGPVVWLACHTTVCGHLTTRHDMTATGALACRTCGSVTAPGQSR
ncbi:hypothetical protein ACFVWX_29100 [Streptomyces sp. NPDC058220]|uniref:hypothetical protein n=1 Tax=Streptomyces sp. NPDC058220 TaxID=3346387 RepID=UPI0036EC62F9